MPNEPIKVNLNLKEIELKLLDLAKKGENLRPLMKNIAGIFADSTEENLKQEGRPDKWVELSETTKNIRRKKGHYPGQILQVKGQLASSISTYYDNNSALIGSNLNYAAIHQLGGMAGKNKKIKITARPYLSIQDNEKREMQRAIEKFLKTR